MTRILISLLVVAVAGVSAHAGTRSLEVGTKFLAEIANITSTLEGLYSLENGCESYQLLSPSASSANKAKNLVDNCEKIKYGNGAPSMEKPAGLGEDFNGAYVDYIMQFIFSLTFYGKTTVLTHCATFIDARVITVTDAPHTAPSSDEYQNTLVLISFFAGKFPGKPLDFGKGKEIFDKILLACTEKNQTNLANACRELIVFCVTPVEQTTVSFEETTVSEEATTETIENVTEGQITCDCIDGFFLTLKGIFGEECACDQEIAEMKKKLLLGECFFCENGFPFEDYVPICDDIQFNFLVKIHEPKFLEYFKFKGFHKKYMAEVQVCGFAPDQSHCLNTIYGKWTVIGKELYEEFTNGSSSEEIVSTESSVTSSQ